MCRNNGVYLILYGYLVYYCQWSQAPLLTLLLRAFQPDYIRVLYGQHDTLILLFKFRHQ